MSVDARSMRARALACPGVFTDERRPVPRPGHGQVLVRVSFVGICGSDLHFYRHGRVGTEVVTAPLVLGHESSGWIEEVGPGVSEERLGERVSIEPQRPCRTCVECRGGHYHLCSAVEFFGAPPVDGALQESVVIDADFAHAIPDRVSLRQAALIEPLSVALSSLRKLSLRGGENLLVAGCGPIGALTAMTALVLGAGSVTLTEMFPERRQLIAEFLDVEAISPETLLDRRFDSFIDTSGQDGAVRQGLSSLTANGIAVLVGVGADELRIDPDLVRRRELTLTGVFRYANTWPAAIRLLARGVLDVDRLISGVYSLDRLEEAFDIAGGPTVMKLLIDLDA